MSTKKHNAGDKVTVLENGTTLFGRTWLRGEVVTLTSGDIELAVDRYGNNLLDMTEAEQIERFGKVRFRLGAPAEGQELHPWDHDEAMKNLKRSDLLAEAALIPIPHERRRAAAEIHEKFGSQSSMGQ